MGRRRLWRVLDEEGGRWETTVVDHRTFRLERATPTTATVYVNGDPVARDVDWDGSEDRANAIIAIYRR